MTPAILLLRLQLRVKKFALELFHRHLSLLSEVDVGLDHAGSARRTRQVDPIFWLVNQQAVLNEHLRFRCIYFGGAGTTCKNGTNFRSFSLAFERVKSYYDNILII